MDMLVNLGDFAAQSDLSIQESFLIEFHPAWSPWSPNRTLSTLPGTLHV
jgi:hypothetical protein